MDAFRLRETVVADYAEYVQSFLAMLDPRIRAFVDERLANGMLWPDPLLQLSPAYQPAEAVEDLAESGLLHRVSARLFRAREAWDRAAEREKVSRSRFAQHAIKPEEVAQELYASDAVLGNPMTVTAFVRAACQRFAVGLRADGPGLKIWLDGSAYGLEAEALPVPVREGLAGSGRRDIALSPQP